MNHLTAEKTVLNFTHRPNPPPLCHLLLMAGIKMDKAQKQHSARRIAYPHHQLAARFKLHFLQFHYPFHLTALTKRRIRNRRNMRFVFIADRQMQHHFPRRIQAQFFELFRGGIGDFQKFLTSRIHGRKHTII